MAIPNFLTGTFGTDMIYKKLTAVTDVQTIMDQLITELVTNLGWTQTVGSLGATSQTFKSPVGAWSANEFFTINVQRAGVAPITTLQMIYTDGYGLLINNITTGHSHIYIDGAGNDVYIYAGNTPRPYVIIDSERVAAAPEMTGCWELDRYPEETVIRPVWVCHPGARTAAEALSYAACDYSLGLDWANGAVAYGTSPSVYNWRVGAPTITRKRQAAVEGALIFTPWEWAASGWFYGRAPQILQIDSGEAFMGEYIVPIDTGTTATFKVVGGATGTYANRMAVRKA